MSIDLRQSYRSGQHCLYSLGMGTHPSEGGLHSCFVHTTWSLTQWQRSHGSDDGTESPSL